MNSPPLAGGINQGGRGRQHCEGVPISTSYGSDAVNVRPTSPSPTASAAAAAQNFLPLPDRGRSVAAAAGDATADATNHNGNHVARQLNRVCNNNTTLAIADSGGVEDIYAKVRAYSTPFDSRFSLLVIAHSQQGK